MGARHKQSGLSLTEMMVVVAAVAMLASLSTPAMKTLFDSMATTGGAKAMISAGLATARAIAAKEQSYAGVRFQTDNPYDPLGASQYMIFIVHDYDATGLVNGFRAVEGIEPIKLPDNIGVMDLRVRLDHVDAKDPSYEWIFDSYSVDPGCLGDEVYLADTMSFSIVFSPSGKMVVHETRVRNRDAQGDSPSYGDSLDDVFNKAAEVDNDAAMFYQDDYPQFGFGAEYSRNRFIILDMEVFRNITDMAERYDYLDGTEVEDVYINPYTGTIVSADR